MIDFINLKAQYQLHQSAIQARINKVLSHGQYIMGPEVFELEDKLCGFSQAKHAITCSSGTDALLMSLIAIGIKPGDVVFVPTFTFPATPEVVVLLGAIPVFVDVDSNTFNLSPESLEDAINLSKKNGLCPRAMIVVDLYGQPAQYDLLHNIARQNNLSLICDAAQSFGASYQGVPVGKLGLLTTSSFFPAKPLGCYGDGGVVLTDNDDLAQTLRSIRLHGCGENKYDIVRIGLNARLDTLQAAILLEKLFIYPNEIYFRNQIATAYTKGLKSFVKTPLLKNDRTSVWAQYTIQVKDRDRLKEYLYKQSIPTMIYYPKLLHTQLPYQKYLLPGQSFAKASLLTQQVLSLPMHAYLKEDTVKLILNTINSFEVMQEKIYA